MGFSQLYIAGPLTPHFELAEMQYGSIDFVPKPGFISALYWDLFLINMKYQAGYFHKRYFHIRHIVHRYLINGNSKNQETGWPGVSIM